jgi:hypothetical protein
MTRLEDRINELQHRQNFFAHLIPLCEAAGCEPLLFKMPEAIFWVAHHIQRDAIVKEIAHSDFETQRGAVISRDYVGAVESLDEAGRAALRARLEPHVLSFVA